MEPHYGKDVCLFLQKTLYGLKQGAHRFWLFLLTIVRGLGCNRSKAHPCLYVKWAATGALLVWLSWVDDCLLTGPEAELMLLKQEFMKQGECEDDGEISEFVGCIIDRNRAERWLKLTQPALLQSLTDEFKITEA
jgi:hypothetical protein